MTDQHSDDEESLSSSSSSDADSSFEGESKDSWENWRVDGERPVRWICHYCKGKLKPGPNLWLSAESRNPFGELESWIARESSRSWELTSARPGWLRYFFCATTCLRRYAFRSRETTDDPLD